MQVINTRDWLPCKRSDHIAFAQTGYLRRTAGFDTYDHYAGFPWKIVESNDAAVQRHSLRFNPDVCAPDAALL